MAPITLEPWTRPPITAVNVTSSTRDGAVVTADSVDGTWSYTWRIDDDRAWDVRHNPTGLTMPFSSIAAGRQWTGGGDGAILDLRALAIHLVTAPFVLVEQRVEASEALITFGHLLPRATDVDARCVCGGYLAASGRAWIHVDTCDEERHNPGPCPDDRNRHHVCGHPDPVRCGHCPRVGDLNAAVCQGDSRGREARHETIDDVDSCCGCCHGEATQI